MTVRRLQNFIGGEFVDAADGRTAPALNPATEQAIATMQASGAEDVGRAVAAARRALPGWAATPPGERARVLLALADRVEASAEGLADVEAADAGKPRRAFLEDELPFIADNLDFFAGAGRLLEGRAAGEYLERRTSVVRREPVGVVGQITPWNYPRMMAVWKIAPALAAGCTCVLKPAETTPASTLALAELAADLLPPGALNVVTAFGEPAGAALVTHPDVAMVSLTGSPETGRSVARAAADTLKRVHLELGGKAPVIVFDDVELEPALERIAASGYYNAGQDCTAATRVLAGEAVYDDVVSRLAERARASCWATPWTPPPRSARSTQCGS